MGSAVTTKITLYQFPGPNHIGSVSPPCLKIALALQFLGLEFGDERLSLKQARNLSPAGQLPVLQLGDEQLVDSVAIMDRLAEDYPAMTPEDDAGRIQDRLWEIFVNDRLYWLGFYLRWLDPVAAPRFAKIVFARVPKPVRWLLRRVHLRRMLKRGKFHGVAGRAPDDIQAELDRTVVMLAKALKGGPFLQGRSTPGRGDFAVASMFAQVAMGNTMPRLKARVKGEPLLSAHIDAVYEACGRKPLRLK